MTNSKNDTRIVIHIYADGRGFVICPVYQDTHAEWHEYQPVQRVSLALGQPTIQRLAQAIQKARAQSQESPGAKWDGDAGRWWAHHLLAMAIVESAGELVLSDLGEDTLLARWPVDTPLSKVAQRIIEQLRKALSPDT